MTEVARGVAVVGPTSSEKFPCPNCHTRTVEKHDDGGKPKYECTVCKEVPIGFTD